MLEAVVIGVEKGCRRDEEEKHAVGKEGEGWMDEGSRDSRAADGGGAPSRGRIEGEDEDEVEEGRGRVPGKVFGTLDLSRPALSAGW